MKENSLKRALNFFNGESGLDNSQIRYFLGKSFKSGDLSKKNILLDLCLIINDNKFDWIELVKEMNLINDIDKVSNEEVKDYVIDLVCDLIFTVKLE